jgi:hypothetical protein
MMKFDRQHGFTQDEALSRLQALTDYWKKQYGVDSRWTGATATIDGKVKGATFKGTVKVDAERLTANIEAGFLAERLGGKAYVEKKLVDYLNPATSLDELKRRNA